jgi:hypothetical protein
MKAVMTAIFRRKRLYAQLPFFEFLRQESVPPLERLAFYPCMAPFILALGDLNKYVLRDEPRADPYQRMVNAYTREGDRRGPWYLDDLAQLGFDLPTTTSDAMRFMFGDELRVSRMLTTRLAHLIYSATPVERLAIAEAIEATGQVLFGITANIARQIEACEGVDLELRGDCHFGRGDDAVLAAVSLDDDERSACLGLVDKVFRLFEEWTGELLAYACKFNRATRSTTQYEEIVLEGEAYEI